jgi:hypothetical protein
MLNSGKIWYVPPELLIFLIILKLIKFWVWVTKPNIHIFKNMI